MTFDVLYQKVLEFLPQAEIGEDNEGQLVIYTNKMLVNSIDGIVKDKVVDFEPEEDL